MSDVDRVAARRALARNWPNLEPSSVKFNAFVEALAQLHRSCGAEDFELRYNLRVPRDRCEIWTKQFMHKEITEAEFGKRLRADATRPIDLEMLRCFCDAFQARVKHYGEILQTAVIKPHASSNSHLQQQALEIDDHIAKLNDKLPLWRENLETVFEFLEEQRVESGLGLVKLGEFEGTSVHWLTELIFKRISEAWQSCRSVANRSQNDEHYLYAADAISLFNKVWFFKFPNPQGLCERLREEFIFARLKLKNSPASPSAEQSDSIERTELNDEVGIDNESRELILVGEMQKIIGQAGHIYRPTANSDWGIDGEIEFKNSIGRASGRRLYVQLKSGDSYLVRRVSDGEEIFTVKNKRHLEYWTQHAYPVMLVIRQSNGIIRWMDVSAYLRANPNSSQIVFKGASVSATAIRDLAASVSATNL